MLQARRPQNYVARLRTPVPLALDHHNGCFSDLGGVRCGGGDDDDDCSGKS